MTFKTDKKFDLHLVRFDGGTAIVGTLKEAWALIFKLREVTKK